LEKDIEDTYNNLVKERRIKCKLNSWLNHISLAFEFVIIMTLSHGQACKYPIVGSPSILHSCSHTTTWT